MLDIAIWDIADQYNGLNTQIVEMCKLLKDISKFTKMSIETFERCTEKWRALLQEKLRSIGMYDEIINDIISSGYYMMNQSDEIIYDSFYGRRYSISIEVLKKNLQNNTQIFRPRGIQSIEVKSIADAKIQIDKFISKFNPELSNRWAYRGENSIFTFKRKFLNPWISNSNGEERSLMPSHWRGFRNDYMKRISYSSRSIFQTIHADDIIYDGIKDFRNLSAKNYNKYGIHTLSDLEDFPEPENQEYFKRWQAHKINPYNSPDMYYLEQHYGFSTPCLDITFDLATAMFFALNKYVEIDRIKKVATYKPVDDISQSVVYVFCFPSDIMTSNDIIRKFDVFSHLEPLRPLRQTCQQFGTNMFNINEPAAYIALQVRFSSDFDLEGLPTQKDLIPFADEDKFYAKLLEMKSKDPDIWGNITEYII